MAKSIWETVDGLADRAVKLESDGLSCAAIAKALGHGLTQRAVVGKLYRLRGEKPRNPDKKPPQRSSKPKKPSPITIMLPPGSDGAVLKPTPLPPEENIITPWTIGNVETGQCRWVYGEPRADASLCGEKVHRRSLCQAHYIRSWVPAPKREAGK